MGGGDRRPRRDRRRDPVPAGRERGLSQVELLVALTVALVGLGGLSFLYLASVQSNKETQSHIQAIHALQGVADTIRGTPYDSIYAQYNAATFAIDEIEGACAVTLFVDETDTSAEAVRFGLPRDLNGDGDADDVDVSAEYVLLPVLLVLEWDVGPYQCSKSLRILIAE